MFGAENAEQLVAGLSYSMIGAALVTAIVLGFVITAPYGRYWTPAWGFLINGKLAWFLQELPSFMVPVLLLLFTDTPASFDTTNKILLAMFLLHYLQRAFIYPALIPGGKGVPFVTFVLAMGFCVYNGYMQGASLLHVSRYDPGWRSNPRYIIGSALFFIGMGTNLHSDHILRNLRRPGETTYKIPKGGAFQLVSGANLFGETVEWLGFAIACWSLPAFAFFVFALCNLGPRACSHHRWYVEKFKDEYPKNRKAFIPFLL